MAAERGHQGVIKTLLECGASIDIPDAEGRTAIHKASRRGHKEIVEMLLKKGANLSLQSCEGFTPLHEAAQNGQIEAVQQLVEIGKVDVEIAEITGRSAMHLAYDEEAKLSVLRDKPSQYSSRAVIKNIHFDVGTKNIQHHSPAEVADRFHEVRTYLRNARRPGNYELTFTIPSFNPLSSYSSFYTRCTCTFTYNPSLVLSSLVPSLLLTETIALLKGAYEGDDKMVIQALRENACVEAKDERMRTPLALATGNILSQPPPPSPPYTHVHTPLAILTHA